MRSVSLVQTEDRNVNQLQQNILQALRPLLQNPLLNGEFIESVSLVTGDNTILHGLDRKVQGYLVVLKSAAVTIYDKQDTNNTPNLTLILNSSGTATVTLYVF